MYRTRTQPIAAALTLKGGETITFKRENSRGKITTQQGVVDARYLPDEVGELMARVRGTLYVLNVLDILRVEPADPTIGQEIQYYRANGVGGQRVSATVLGFQRLEAGYMLIDVEAEGHRFTITNHDIVGRIFG